MDSLNGRFIGYFKSERWYKDGYLHREGGPAIIYKDGTKIWYKYGKLHREDGAAVIYPNGETEWWINNINLTKEEWWEQLSDEQKLKALFNGEAL